MKYYTFEIVVEKEENGKTIEAARKNVREAIELHIESLSKRSKKIPQAEKLVHVEEISIGLPS